MISFRNAEEERAFVEMADAFAKEQLRVQARIAEEQKEVPNGLAERAVELGLCSLEVPESMEGLGLPLISQVQVLEALAFGDLAILQGLPGPNDFASFLRVVPNLPNVRSYLANGSHSQFPTAAVIDALNPHVAWDSGLTVEPSDEGYVLCGLSRPIRMGKYAEVILVACRDTTGEAVLLLLDAKRTPWQVLPCDVRLGLLPAGIARVRLESRSVSLEDVLSRGEEAETALYQAMARQHVLEAAKEIGLMRASHPHSGREAFAVISFEMTDQQKQVKELVHWFAKTEMRPLSPL